MLKKIHEEVKPRTWCCLNQGTSSWSVEVEQDVYMPKATARSIVSIDNTKCNKPMMYMTASFDQHMKIQIAEQTSS